MIPRSAGILLHPTSLPSRLPAGDLGPCAHAFADFLARAGQGWWQMLPIGPVDEEHSPYKSTSACAGNPLLISPEALVEDGLLSRADLPRQSPAAAGVADLRANATLRSRLLAKAYATFAASPRHSAWRRACAAFAEEQADWLDDAALFSALAATSAGDWTSWEPALRRRSPAALARARRARRAAYDFAVFAQWQFAVQWRRLRDHCTARGVRLIGDMPFFVAHHSADVWANQELFVLDRQGRPTVVAGVPPDYFARDGQVWNVPLYAWPAHRHEGYGWWARRLGALTERFDLVRIDHFLGLVRTFAIPAGATTARAGRYRPSPGAALLRAVRRRLAALPLIAEDLGATTPRVRTLIRANRIPGMRVLQFELEAFLASGRPPRGTASAVMYTGTHDNDTMMGWYGALAPARRRRLRELLPRTRPFSWAASWAGIAACFATACPLAMVPLQDVLGLDSTARMNIPGTASGNWRWRMADAALTAGLARRLRSCTRAAGRCR